MYVISYFSIATAVLLTHFYLIAHQINALHSLCKTWMIKRCRLATYMSVLFSHQLAVCLSKLFMPVLLVLTVT